MSTLEEIHTDARQTPEWGKYMESIGWETKTVDGVAISIRQVRPFTHSLIKIAHSKDPMPFAAIDKIAAEHKALFIIIEPHVINYDEKAYREHGYMVSKIKSSIKTTRLIDLRPESEKEIWKSFSENAQRNIKKAEKNGLEVRHISMADSNNYHYFDIFHKLYSQLGKRKNFYTHPYQESRDKMLAFKDSTVISFAYEKDSDEPIACVWYSWFDKTLAYFHVGINQTGYDKLANYLLVWEGVKMGKQKGLEVLDFEGVFDKRSPGENKSWKGYTEFKERFHGQLVEYPDSWIKIYNKPYKIFYLCATTIFPS